MAGTRIWGVRRLHFLLILTLVALVIGGIVGGIMGSRKTSQKNLDSKNPEATQAPVATAPTTVTVPALASGSDFPPFAGAGLSANSESVGSKSQASPAGETMTVTQSKSFSTDQPSDFYSDSPLPPVTVTISDFYSDFLSTSSDLPVTIAVSPPLTVTVGPPPPVTISPPPPVTVIISPPLTIPPSPIPPPPRTIVSICASNNNFGAAESIQVYYLDSTGSIMMNQNRVSWSGYDGVHVSINPKHGSPLSSISWSLNGNDYHRLYYLDADSNIVEAESQCTGTSTCSWFSANLVSVEKVESTGGLAAVWLGQTWGIRLYYLDTGAMVSELAWTPKGGWQRKNLGPQADASSSLAVEVISGTLQIQVYFFGNAGDLQQSYLRTDWEWTTLYRAFTRESTTPLAAVSWANPYNQRVYHVDSNGLEEFSFLKTWQTKFEQSPAWDRADAAGTPVGATSWGSNSVRVYYLSQGSIVEAALEGTTWFMGGL